MKSLTGWIIYNGNLESDAFFDFANMIQHAAEKQCIDTTIYKNNELLSLLMTNQLQIIYEENKDLPDFIVFADKDIYLAKQLEALGIRLFNGAETIRVSDDKIASYQVLAKHQLPIPKTIIAPKIFKAHNQLDITYTEMVANHLSFPLIIKEAFGSFGEQVYLIQTFDEMIQVIKQLGEKPFIFQQFISSSYGRDIRLQVVGNKVVASMKRTSERDFRANVTAGATMESYLPSAAEKKLAIRAAKAIGADFAGVDLLFGPDEKRIICEVNSNAHIRNLYDCTGINVADAIISHIKNTLNEGKMS